MIKKLIWAQTIFIMTYIFALLNLILAIKFFIDKNIALGIVQIFLCIVNSACAIINGLEARNIAKELEKKEVDE